MYYFLIEIYTANTRKPDISQTNTYKQSSFKHVFIDKVASVQHQQHFLEADANLQLPRLLSTIPVTHNKPRNFTDFRNSDLLLREFQLKVNNNLPSSLLDPRETVQLTLRKLPSLDISSTASNRHDDCQ